MGDAPQSRALVLPRSFISTELARLEEERRDARAFQQSRADFIRWDIALLRARTNGDISVAGLDEPYIPAECFTSEGVKSFSLMGCGFEHLPDAFSAVQGSIVDASFSNNKLVDLPASMRHMAACTSLQVDNNAFETMPAVVFELFALRVLNVFNNRMVTIAPGLGRLSKLRVLCVDCNQLESLPDCFDRLTCLEELSAARNNLTALPPSIGGHPALATVRLAFNRFQEFPIILATVKTLRCLDIGGNKLKSLPESVGTLSFLEKFNISNNFITALPYSIGELALLQEFQLMGNPLRRPPMHFVIEHGLKYLRPYYQREMALMVRMRARQLVHRFMTALRFIQAHSIAPASEFRADVDLDIGEGVLYPHFAIDAVATGKDGATVNGTFFKLVWPAAAAKWREIYEGGPPAVPITGGVSRSGTAAGAPPVAVAVGGAGIIVGDPLPVATDATTSRRASLLARLGSAVTSRPSTSSVPAAVHPAPSAPAATLGHAAAGAAAVLTATESVLPTTATTVAAAAVADNPPLSQSVVVSADGSTIITLGGSAAGEGGGRRASAAGSVRTLASTMAAAFGGGGRRTSVTAATPGDTVSAAAAATSLASGGAGTTHAAAANAAAVSPAPHLPGAIDTSPAKSGSRPSSAASAKAKAGSGGTSPAAATGRRGSAAIVAVVIGPDAAGDPTAVATGGVRAAMGGVGSLAGSRVSTASTATRALPLPAKWLSVGDAGIKFSDEPLPPPTADEMEAHEHVAAYDLKVQMASIKAPDLDDFASLGSIWGHRPDELMFVVGICEDALGHVVAPKPATVHLTECGCVAAGRSLFACSSPASGFACSRKMTMLRRALITHSAWDTLRLDSWQRAAEEDAAVAAEALARQSLRAYEVRTAISSVAVTKALELANVHRRREFEACVVGSYRGRIDRIHDKYDRQRVAVAKRLNALAQRLRTELQAAEAALAEMNATPPPATPALTDQALAEAGLVATARSGRVGGHVMGATARAHLVSGKRAVADLEQMIGLKKTVLEAQIVNLRRQLGEIDLQAELDVFDELECGEVKLLFGRVVQDCTLYRPLSRMQAGWYVFLNGRRHAEIMKECIHEAEEDFVDDKKVRAVRIVHDMFERVRAFSNKRKLGFAARTFGGWRAVASALRRGAGVGMTEKLVDMITDKP